MNSRYLVTIVVPVYNVEPYIKTCLESIASQSYSDPIECVIVDDCGTDDSMRIVERFIEEYNGTVDFRIVSHEQNKGISCARNTGLQESNGRYVIFIDSDDWISNDCVEKLTAPLKNHAVDYVVGNYQVVGSQKSFAPLRLSQGLYEGHSFITAHFMDVYLMPWNKLCRKNYLLDNDIYFPAGLIREDPVWHMLMSFKADSIYVIQDITYLYRVRENSIMTEDDESRNLRHRDAIVKGLQYVNDYARSHCDSKDYSSFVILQKNLLSRWLMLGDEIKSFKKRVDLHSVLWEKNHFDTWDFIKSGKIRTVRYTLNYWLPDCLATVFELIISRLRHLIKL